MHSCEARLGEREAARIAFQQVAQTTTGELQAEARRQLAFI